MIQWLMLAEAGISMRDVTDKLLDEGVQLFSDAFESCLKQWKSKAERQGREK